MTERNASASATAKTNTGVLRFAQDDGVKRATSNGKGQCGDLSVTRCASVEMTDFWVGKKV
jgi:hypothetical protein